MRQKEGGVVPVLSYTPLFGPSSFCTKYSTSKLRNFINALIRSEIINRFADFDLF